MKKKILLFASTVLAAMLMTTSAFAAENLGDVNGDGIFDEVDSALILKQALSKDFKDSQEAKDANFDESLANADQDLGVAADTKYASPQVTANDAAFVYRLYLEANTLMLDVNIAGVTASEIVTMDTPVKEVVERFVGPDAKYDGVYETKVQPKVADGIAKVKFYSGSDEVGDVYLTEDAGWDIFGYAVRSLVNNQEYTKVSEKAIFDANGGDIKTVNDIDLVSVATESNQGADMDVFDYQWVKRTYQTLLSVLKLNPSAQDIIDAKDGVTDVTGTKYAVHLTFNHDESTESHYTSKEDDTLNAIIEKMANDGLFDYENVTVGDYNNSIGKEMDSSGEYGSIQLQIGARKFNFTLVQRNASEATTP